MKKVILAKNITDCDDCPLQGHDCPGGWTSGGGGEPIEPPCCSWDEDTEVYEGMYENCVYEPSEMELRIEREAAKRKEEKREIERGKIEKNDMEIQINAISRFGNARIKDVGELSTAWYCPHCHNWFRPFFESYHNGIHETRCPVCGENLAYSSLLDNN